MMTHFSLSDLNIWAILVAGAVNMLIGAAWYSTALFGKQWMGYLGFKSEELNPSPWLFVVVFLLGLVIALVMAMFLRGVEGAVQGLAYAGLISLAFVIPTMITHYLYEQRKGGFMLIAAGHEFVLFLAYGAILGGWQ
jgi:hypothetical protein